MKRPCLPLPAVKAEPRKYLPRTDYKYCWTTNILTPENYPLYGMEGINEDIYRHCIVLVMKPAKVQLIQPPIIIMGRTLVNVPFIISNAMFGSAVDRWWAHAQLHLGQHSH